MEEELKELLKKYIKHSLCTTPKGIQSRVYLDSEEISNLKTELPHACNLSGEWQYLTDDEIKEIIGSYGNESGIGGYTRELFDKIEAKIREKNERKSKENN